MDRPAKEEETQEEPQVCDVCGAPVIMVHGKIVCRNCGYTRDCSDP